MSELNVAAEEAEPATYSLGHFCRYMLALGTWGFGGPVALIGYMYRDLVEQRRWISEANALATVVILWRFKTIPEPVLVFTAALLGLALYPRGSLP